MKITIVANRDATAELFSKPEFYVNRAVAIRSFGEQVNTPDPQNTMNKYPEQFSLWELGVYDDNTGEITLNKDGPEKLIRAVDVLRTNGAN